jgi:RNA polymerase sigma-70 factor (ECF subfamily)
MQKTDENPEERFLRLAAEGDKQAFGMLYERYLDEIYRFVFYKVGSQPTAEDLTEEAFLRAWEYLPRIYKKDQKMDNFRAWVYRIANNLVIDFYRKKKPVENIEAPEIGTTALPESVAIANEQSQQLAQSIRKLKPDHQQIIILRLVNDLSHKEAASIMNISENHSRVLLYRALKKLKDNLIKKEGSHA